MNKFQFINDTIEQRAELFCEASDKIWEYAEVSLEEKKSSALIGQKRYEYRRSDGDKLNRPKSFGRSKNSSVH